MFEDLSINKDAYEAITSEAFYSYIQDKDNIITFDRNECDKIKYLFLGYEVCNLISFVEITGKGKHSGYENISMYKIQDDWYVLVYTYWSFINHKRGVIQEHFRCDRWDGLMNCLKNECL